MERHGEIETARRKADDFVDNLLKRVVAGTPTQETARSITELAFGDCNPLKDLFSHAANHTGIYPSR